MSYGRNPHYIWSDGEFLHFEMTSVPEAQINAFLYKVLLTNRRDELAERLRAGREEWTKQEKVVCVDGDGNELPKNNPANWEHVVIVPMPHDDHEYVEYMEWMKSKEDDIIKQLMGEEV